MAEFSRSDDPLSDPEYLLGWYEETRGNPRLNRSAEVVGRGVGTAVYAVKRLPRQIEGIKTRLHVVSGRTRQTASETARGIAETGDTLKQFASHKAAELRDAARARVAGLSNAAAARGVELAERADQRLAGLRRQAARQWNKSRQAARHRIEYARSQAECWQREYPLQTLAAIGGAAFVAGLALRLWRSDRD